MSPHPSASPPLLFSFHPLTYCPFVYRVLKAHAIWYDVACVYVPPSIVSKSVSPRQNAMCFRIGFSKWGFLWLEADLRFIPLPFSLACFLNE